MSSTLINQTYYVKKYNTSGFHQTESATTKATFEILGNKLYEMLGVPVTDVVGVLDENNQLFGIASLEVNLTHTVKDIKLTNNDAQRAKLLVAAYILGDNDVIGFPATNHADTNPTGQGNNVLCDASGNNFVKIDTEAVLASERNNQREEKSGGLAGRSGTPDISDWLATVYPGAVGGLYSVFQAPSENPATSTTKKTKGQKWLERILKNQFKLDKAFDGISQEVFIQALREALGQMEQIFARLNTYEFNGLDQGAKATVVEMLTKRLALIKAQHPDLELPPLSMKPTEPVRFFPISDFTLTDDRKRTSGLNAPKKHAYKGNISQIKISKTHDDATGPWRAMRDSDIIKKLKAVSEVDKLDSNRLLDHLLRILCEEIEAGNDIFKQRASNQFIWDLLIVTSHHAKSTPVRSVDTLDGEVKLDGDLTDLDILKRNLRALADGEPVTLPETQRINSTKIRAFYDNLTQPYQSDEKADDTPSLLLSTAQTRLTGIQDAIKARRAILLQGNIANSFQTIRTELRDKISEKHNYFAWKFSWFSSVTNGERRMRNALLDSGLNDERALLKILDILEERLTNSTGKKVGDYMEYATTILNSLKTSERLASQTGLEEKPTINLEDDLLLDS